MTGLYPALAMTILTLASLIGLSVAPRPGDPLLAVYPGAMSDAERLRAVDAAGSALLAPASVPSALVVSNPAPGTAQRLREGGAVVVINAPFPSVCTRTTARPSARGTADV